MDSFERRAYTVQEYRNEIKSLEQRIQNRRDTLINSSVDINLLSHAQVTRINRYDKLKSRSKLINLIDYKTIKHSKKEIEDAESRLLKEKQAFLDFEAETTQMEKDLDNLRNEYETYLDAVYRKEPSGYFGL